jgi:ElaB/YqjD/DUF883 family membrane-anchored ribosome-binding protein
MANESVPRPGGRKSRTQEEMNNEIDELQYQLQELARTVSNVASKRIRTTQESLETTIRENPIASVSIAAAIGFLYAMIRR